MRTRVSKYVLQLEIGKESGKRNLSIRTWTSTHLSNSAETIKPPSFDTSLTQNHDPVLSLSTIPQIFPHLARRHYRLIDNYSDHLAHQPLQASRTIRSTGLKTPSVHRSKQPATDLLELFCGVDCPLRTKSRVPITLMHQLQRPG